MKILGAIMAGGGATRFGSDKAMALVEGLPLVAHVARALAPQVDAVVICGPSREGIPAIGDAPAPDLGPLGGLCGALLHAAANGYDAVLTAGCDVLPVPYDLRERLTPGPAVIIGQPLFGLWPAALAPRLLEQLHGDSDRSMRRWAAISAARSVPLEQALHNLNTPADLAAYLTR